MIEHHGPNDLGSYWTPEPVSPGWRALGMSLCLLSAAIVLAGVYWIVR